MQRVRPKSGRAFRSVFLMLMLSSVVRAEDFTLKTFRVPAEVDGDEVPSGIFLQCKVKDYNLPLEKFAALPNKDQRERLFLQTVNVLRSNDLSAFRKLWGPVRPASASTDPKEQKKKIETAMTPTTAEDDFAGYRANFEDFASMQVDSQILAGSRSIFMWYANAKTGPLETDFIVSTPTGGQPKVGAPDSESDPGDYLIIFTMQERKQDPGNFGPAIDPKLTYHYALPLEGKGQPGKEPVYLEFNGERVNFDVFDPSAPASDPVLDFYRSAYLTYKKKDLEGFEAMYTPKSAQKLKKSYAAMKKDVFDQYYSMTTAGRYVKFVIKADPIYLIFYSSHKGDDWRPGKLPYDYVVRDAKTGTFKLTNLFYEDFLDGVLKNPDLFDQSFFKPPLQQTTQKALQNTSQKTRKNDLSK